MMVSIEHKTRQVASWASKETSCDDRDLADFVMHGPCSSSQPHSMIDVEEIYDQRPKILGHLTVLAHTLTCAEENYS